MNHGLSYQRKCAAQSGDCRGTTEALELIQAGGLLGRGLAFEGGDVNDVGLAALQVLVHAGGTGGVGGALMKQRACRGGHGTNGEEDDVASVHDGVGCCY
jgi:hypothetical protein